MIFEAFMDRTRGISFPKDRSFGHRRQKIWKRAKPSSKNK